jgi:hypothetical protein
MVLQVSKGKKRVPRRQFFSLLVGPQLQAQWTDPETAKAMRYAVEQLKISLEQVQALGHVSSFKDFTSGSALLERFAKGLISEDDILLLFSADGAQLYRHKDSDCWMATFTILNLPPDMRYKMSRMLPQVFIPGPNKPKQMDSFLFRTFHHVCALMKSGLRICLSGKLIHQDKAQLLVIPTHPHMASRTGDKGWPCA